MTRQEEEYLRLKREALAFEQLEEKIGSETVDCRHDAVKSPSHYMFFDIEAIDIIKASMTADEFKGYCKGNSLKYRLRAGKKDDVLQDIGKAEQYEKMFKETI